MYKRQTQLYPRMQSMMDYVLGRTNANGMVCLLYTSRSNYLYAGVTDVYAETGEDQLMKNLKMCIRDRSWI